MNHVMNRFRRIARQSSVVRDDRGLSTVEYVIILVLIAAAAVTTWSKFGGMITEKLKGAENKIESEVTMDGKGQGDSQGQGKSDH
jgi:Flp pilus assembly pilin Flp